MHHTLTFDQKSTALVYLILQANTMYSQTALNLAFTPDRCSPRFAPDTALHSKKNTAGSKFY